MGLYSRVMGGETPISGILKLSPYLTSCSLVQSRRQTEGGKQFPLEEKETAEEGSEGGQKIKRFGKEVFSDIRGRYGWKFEKKNMHRCGKKEED